MISEPWGPPWVRKLHTFVSYPWFGHFITFVIVLNTIVMGMERFPSDVAYVHALETANLVFTIIFAVEMVLKLVGLGLRGYVSDAFNIFDGVVVVISLVDLIMTALSVGSGSGLGVLRSFRLLRVFKLARSWKDLQTLLNTILLSLKDVSNATILLVLIMFIFALVGMQLFGAQCFCSFSRTRKTWT